MGGNRRCSALKRSAHEQAGAADERWPTSRAVHQSAAIRFKALIMIRSTAVTGKRLLIVSGMRSRIPSGSRSCTIAAPCIATPTITTGAGVTNATTSHTNAENAKPASAITSRITVCRGSSFQIAPKASAKSAAEPSR